MKYQLTLQGRVRAQIHQVNINGGAVKAPRAVCVRPKSFLDDVKGPFISRHRLWTRTNFYKLNSRAFAPVDTSCLAPAPSA